MAKSKVVDHFEWHHDKSKWPITLNTETGVFSLWMKEHDKSFNGKDLEKVKKDAWAWLEASAQLDFKPMILATTKERWRSGGDHGINFSYERCFKGVRPDGEVVWKKWQDDGDIPEGKHSWLDCLEGKPAHDASRPDANDVVIPYTNERWIGLRKITEMFEKLQERFEELITPGTMEHFLTELARKDVPLLLGGPDKKKA